MQLKHLAAFLSLAILLWAMPAGAQTYEQATTFQWSPSTAGNVAVPATVTVGDIWVVFIDSTAGETLLTPSNWTQDCVSQANGATAAVYHHIVAGGESGPITFITSAAGYGNSTLLDYSGQGGSPLNGTPSCAALAATQTATPAAPSGASGTSVNILFVAQSNGTYTVNTPSSGVALRSTSALAMAPQAWDYSAVPVTGNVTVPTSYQVVAEAQVALQAAATPTPTPTATPTPGAAPCGFGSGEFWGCGGGR